MSGVISLIFQYSGDLSNDIGSPVERRPAQTNVVASNSHGIMHCDHRQPKFHINTSAASVQAPSKIQFKPFSIVASSKLKTSANTSAVASSTQNGMHNNTSSSVLGTQLRTCINPSSTVVCEQKRIQSGSCTSLVPSTNGVKPRLVMRIKHGSVCYNSVEDGKGSTDSSQPKPKLVPYNGESDDDETPTKINGMGSSTHNNDTKSHPMNLVGKQQDSSEPITGPKMETVASVPQTCHSVERESYCSTDRKPEKAKSPTQPSTSLGLTVDISQAKVNATSKWNVLSADAQVSPSLASGSSNCSINSTTEWRVRETVKHTVPVLPSNLTAPSTPWTNVSTEKHQTCDGEISGCVNSNSRNIKIQHSKCVVDGNRDNSQTTPVLFDNELNTSASKSHKKHKDKKHKHYNGRDHSDLSSSHKKKKHKKKHKRKKYEDLDDEERPVKKRRSEDGDYMWIEKTRDLSEENTSYTG